MARTKGRRTTDFRNEMKAIWKPANAACALCGQATIDWDAPANQDESFELDHRLSIKHFPHLEFEPSNAQPSHHLCNRTKGEGQMPVAVGITSEEW